MEFTKQTFYVKQSMTRWRKRCRKKKTCKTLQLMLTACLVSTCKYLEIQNGKYSTCHLQKHGQHGEINNKFIKRARKTMCKQCLQLRVKSTSINYKRLIIDHKAIKGGSYHFYNLDINVKLWYAYMNYHLVKNAAPKNSILVNIIQKTFFCNRNTFFL